MLAYSFIFHFPSNPKFPLFGGQTGQPLHTTPEMKCNYNLKYLNFKKILEMLLPLANV